MTRLLKSDGQISFIESGEIQEKLEPGNYLLKRNSFTEEYYLLPMADFQIPKKIYGNYSEDIARWKKSWENNPDKNLGVLLSGIKGSGKTILCKQFCKEINIPIIIISESYNDSEFLAFMSNPCLSNSVVFIDEYDKLVNRNNGIFQEMLLSLMDGNFNNRMLFLITVNNEDCISNYMYNRLNRIKYCKNFENLDTAIVNEVIKDSLINKDHSDSIHVFFAQLGIITYDLLINIINECNLFDRDALYCGKFLNLKSEERYYNLYEIANDDKYLCRNAIETDFRSGFYITRNEVISKELDQIIETQQLKNTGKPLPLELRTHFEVSREQYQIERYEDYVEIRIKGTELLFRAEPMPKYSVF